MAEDAPSVDLRILSPSFENGIQLANLPATTTIGALRLRIHDAAPSRPAPDHMRLIYRGRVVANDSDTLQTIFGIENIRESKDQTLHLVLREQPGATSTPSPAPPPASAPPNPVQNPLQTNPFRNLPEPRPSSQPHAPQPQHPQIHQQPPFLHPPGLQARIEALRNGEVPAANQMPAQPIPNIQAGTPPAPQGAQGQQPGQPMGLPNLPAGTTRTVRREGFGPNGERWTVTWNNSTVVNPGFNPVNVNPNPQFVAHRPYPNSFPGLGLPTQRTPSPSRAVSADEIVQRVSMNLGRARVEVQNMTALSRPPGAQSAPVALSQLPPYRIPYLRSCMRSLLRVLDNVDQDLLLLQTSRQSVRTPEFVDLTQAGIDLRRQAMDFANLINQLPPSELNVPSSPAVPTPPPVAVPTPTTTQPQQSTQQPPSDTPTELFILSSPQGPVGILFDQQGTYSTAPVMPTMPFQTFTQNFMANRQHVAAIGQQLAANIQAFPQTRFAAMPGQQAPQPTGTQPAVVVQQPGQNGNQAQAQAQPLAAAPIANADQPQVLEAAPENNRVDNIAGHLWLIFKLACFVYFFAGGPGWYRPIMICLIAGIVYLAQVGIFEDHLTAARQYLENLLPPGAFGDAAAPANRANNNAAVAAAAGVPQQAQRRVANRNLTPEQVAQRLQQQHRDQRFGWIRETMRTTERAVALFVASLWPGIGERMVQAQEERVRAERAAEEERERAEEEARRREEEEKTNAEAETEKGKEREKVDEHGGPEHTQAQTAEAGVSFEGKGKEKARVENANDEVD